MSRGPGERPPIPGYTPSHPCRCGFDGTGTHQCHAGRDEAWLASGGQRCPNPANDYLVVQPVCLAGVQLKFGVTMAHYCEKCAILAGIVEGVPRV